MTWITARYPGKCAECEEPFEVGDRIVLSGAPHHDDRKIYCTACGTEVDGADPQATMKQDYQKKRWSFE